MPKSCQRRVNFSFLCANLPINVSTCQRHTKDVPKACQLLIFMCNRANKRANVPMASQRRTNFSSWHANLLKGVPFFSTSPAKKCANFSTIFQKNYIFYIQNISIPNILYNLYILNIYLIYIFYMIVFFLTKFIRRL